MTKKQIIHTQKRVGTTPDSFWGPKSIAACQRHLRKLMPSPHPWPSSSQRALQKFYGDPGDESEMTRIKAPSWMRLYDLDKDQWLPSAPGFRTNSGGPCEAFPELGGFLCFSAPAQLCLFDPLTRKKRNLSKIGFGTHGIQSGPQGGDSRRRRRREQSQQTPVAG